MDLTFDGAAPNALPAKTPEILGADGGVHAVLPLPDGRFLIGGRFTKINGVRRNNVAIINANGTVDLSFDPGEGVEERTFENCNDRVER